MRISSDEWGSGPGARWHERSKRLGPGSTPRRHAASSRHSASEGCFASTRLRSAGLRRRQPKGVRWSHFGARGIGRTTALMASAMRNERGYWLDRWKDASGHWRTRRAIPNTRKAAQELAEELELRARRQLDGLKPLPPSDGGGTVGESLGWWLRMYSPRLASHPSNEMSIRTHLLSSGTRCAAAPRSFASLTYPCAFLDRKEREELSPRTLNHLRGFLSRAFTKAIEVGRWPGANPLQRVTPRPVGGKRGDFLRAEEVPRVLSALNPRWRPLFVTAVYTGMRKGELLALRREDVDLQDGSILVRRSWGAGHDEGRARGRHSDSRGPRSLASCCARCLGVLAGLPRARWPDVPTRRAARVRSPPRLGASRHCAALAACVPAEGLQARRGAPRPGGPEVSDVRDEAAREARGETDPVP